MDLVVVRDYAELSDRAAELVADAVCADPEVVLGLPTGKTPLGLYASLARRHAMGLDLSHTTSFNLDEYLGLPPGHQQTFASYMERHVWGKMNFHPSRTHIPASCPHDAEDECRNYEGLIGSAGGLDLVVLGLGDNGHIAFNEPGTPWDSITHVATLTEDTRRKASSDFGGVDAVPRQAITVGIKTIMSARRVLLLVSGRGKSAILARTLLGPVVPDVPASVLRLHPAAVVLADRLAVAELG